MKAIGTWKGGFETELTDGRGHAVVVDLPEDEDGRDAGTSALELSVLSLAGCICTIFALVARRRRLRFESMTVDLDAQRPPRSPTITGVEGTLRIATSAPADEVAIVLGITLRTCPVGVLLERAKVPVHVRPVIVSAASRPAVPGRPPP